MTETGQEKAFKDEFVIYYSKEDASWIAHSLHTDQIGLGDCVVDAIVDLMVCLHNLCELAKKQRDIQRYVEAPEDIQKLRQNARSLPDCIAQIAVERFYHQFPSEWSVQINIPQSECVTMPLELEGCNA